MTWPQTPLRTYAPGIAIQPTDLNELQRAVNVKAHGTITEAYPVDRRLRPSGTGWAVDETSASPGSISESANNQTCLLVLKPPPVGSVITAAGMKVKDGGGTSLLRMELYARSTSESGATPFGTVTTSGSGAIETLDIVTGLGWPYTVVKGERLYVAFVTTGGGVAQRRVYEAYLTYYRP